MTTVHFGWTLKKSWQENGHKLGKLSGAKIRVSQGTKLKFEKFQIDTKYQSFIDNLLLCTSLNWNFAHLDKTLSKIVDIIHFQSSH